MSKDNILLFISILFVVFLFSSCKEIQPPQGSKLSQDDKEIIGSAIDTSIMAHFKRDTSVHVLSPSSYLVAYDYINHIKTNLLNTPYFEKAPTIRLIDQHNYKGAFVGPAGYIYIYRDLLLTLDYESQFVGLLASLMACAESDQPINKLKKTFSLSYLLDIAIGSNVDNTAAVLYELRDVPYDSLWVSTYDDKSINILCTEDYNIHSYADLFLLNNNIEWMTLFPRPYNFSSTLYNRKNQTDCSGETDNQSAYTTLRNNI